METIDLRKNSNNVEVVVKIQNGCITAVNGCDNVNALAGYETNLIPGKWPGKFESILADLKSILIMDERASFFGGSYMFNGNTPATPEYVREVATNAAAVLHEFRTNFKAPEIVPDGSHTFTVQI